MFQTDAGSCGDKRKNCSDEQLAQKAKGGDTDALAQLISHFLPVIKAKSGRYSLVGLEQDDFIQEGLIGLFNAVKNYDPARGASFDTYARRCIHSRMVECLSASLAQKHLPLRDYLPIDSLEHAAGPDSDGDPLEVYLQQEEELLRRQKIKTLLSGLEQETITLYLSGLSYEEMAQRLHCSTKAVDNALQRVRRKLRNSSR